MSCSKCNCKIECLRCVEKTKEYYFKKFEGFFKKINKDHEQTFIDNIIKSTNEENPDTFMLIVCDYDRKYDPSLEISVSVISAIGSKVSISN
jgi:hypothetical protein